MLVACHNRRQTTLRCLASLTESATLARVAVKLYVYDDGSSDGTSAALRSTYPTCSITVGNGSAFWARSMSVVESLALAEASDRDTLFWLNDDVQLDVTAIDAAWKLTRDRTDAIAVLAAREPGRGKISYAGFRRSGWHPLGFEAVAPSESEVTCVDAFNGNMVAVPVSVARRLGGIDGDYSHALADIDYGLRAREQGIDVLLAPSSYGECPRNPPVARSRILADWERFRGPKGGGNYSSVRRFVLRHEPRKWPFAIWATYAKWWTNRAWPG